ncbi:hypothetical protein Srufu_023640 [Streptomyces libani subsp. rufus]|nr:hypothetical protein Srufu_023640 [Streptomyces libani subsp. rufus]
MFVRARPAGGGRLLGPQPHDGRLIDSESHIPHAGQSDMSGLATARTFLPFFRFRTRSHLRKGTEAA